MCVCVCVCVCSYVISKVNCACGDKCFFVAVLVINLMS